MSAASPASPLPFFYGGQAVIEGVLMRGPNTWAVAARRPDGGISLREDRLRSRVYTSAFFGLPFIRGVVGLIEMVHLGTSAMMWSANVKAKADNIEIGRGAIAATITVSMIFSFALFFGLPLMVGGALNNRGGSLGFTAVEGVTRALLLVGYLLLISRIPDVRRLFQYHGAEHKTINAFESGAPVTVEGVAPQSRLHPRCGTGFLVVVVLVSIVVFTFVGRPVLPLLVLSRLLLVPVIAAIAYELIRLGARHAENPMVARLLVPVLAAQYLTTREPDPSMMEVAITAFSAVRSRDVALEEPELLV
ncbi:MAG TPA: DUF1385 domain-containing protein [Candidatus Dormibacteraeota bacterium]|nr:DUF1385 domain-containing protein [Candidatus Dormibacteraeota bacterium]